MKKNIVLLILLLSFKIGTSQNLRKDSILKRTNPKFLNLKKTQIFIDTTRSSEFYLRIKNWKKSKYDMEDIGNYLKRLDKNFNNINIELKDFPKNFVMLRKLNGKFILYDRCDGIDLRFELTKNNFFIYGVWESEVHTISKVVELKKHSLNLELNSIKSRTEFQKSFLELKRIENSIFEINFKNEHTKLNLYLTSLDKISEFDLVVNHCLEMKIFEYQYFDEMKKTKKIEIE
ncbi:hypothetical protein [Tenacibaculum ovolyticum]|uniref:hypothetical protein n=1 Tax=Tenacibaculum ovolyticum TaxID=104270 RepID=UPI003BA8AAAC